MNKKEIILLSVIVMFLGLFIFIFYKNNNEKTDEFYVKVKESFTNSSLVEPLHNEKIYETYPVLQIDLGNLKEEDIIKVKTNGEVLETYPPVVKVENYEFIINNDITTTMNIEEITTKKIDNKTTTKVNIKSTNTTTKIVTTIPTTKITTTKQVTTTVRTTTTTKNNTSKDNIVLAELNNNVKFLENSKNDKKLSEKAKDYFISAVDFIFYDKDIKGVYFKDLTNSAKLKVISLALKMDNLIEKHYPEYKENISSSYKNVKTKLVELYLDKTSEYCAKEGNEKVCEQAKWDFQELKKAYGITWEFIKDLGSKGLTKLKEWYEVYSGK